MLCVTNMLLHGIEDPSFVRHDNTLARPYISYGQSDRVDIVLTNPPFGGREEDGIESNFPQHFRTRETADLFLALIIRLLKPGGRAAVVLPDGSLFGEGVKTRLKEHLMEECNLHTIVRLPNSVFRPYASIGTNLLFFEKRRKPSVFYEPALGGRRPTHPKLPGEAHQASRRSPSSELNSAKGETPLDRIRDIDAYPGVLRGPTTTQPMRCTSATTSSAWRRLQSASSAWGRRPRSQRVMRIR